MMSNARCWTLRFVVLAIATSLLTGCATAGFEAVAPVDVELCDQEEMVLR